MHSRPNGQIFLKTQDKSGQPVTLFKMHEIPGLQGMMVTMFLGSSKYRTKNPKKAISIVQPYIFAVYLYVRTKPKILLTLIFLARSCTKIGFQNFPEILTEAHIKNSCKWVRLLRHNMQHSLRFYLLLYNRHQILPKY